VVFEVQGGGVVGVVGQVSSLMGRFYFRGGGEGGAKAGLAGRGKSSASLGRGPRPLSQAEREARSRYLRKRKKGGPREEGRTSDPSMIRLGGGRGT